MSDLQLFCEGHSICSVSIYAVCSDCRPNSNTIDFVLDNNSYVRISAESTAMYNSWFCLGSSSTGEFVEAVRGRVISSIQLADMPDPNFDTDHMSISCQAIRITFQDEGMTERYVSLCSNSPCLNDAQLLVSLIRNQ